MEKYVNLFEAIITNVYYLKMAASALLEKAIKSKDKIEQRLYSSYALNLLFACTDEIGKFYLIMDKYPIDFDEIDLKKGFREHKAKQSKLIEVTRKRQLSQGGSSQFTNKQTLDFLMLYKHTTLFVDYRERKVITPDMSIALKPLLFTSYPEIVSDLESMMRGDFELFKMHQSNPV